MQAYEITTKILSDGKIILPDNLLKKLKTNKPVRIIILITEETSQESEDWLKMSQEQFLAGYNDADSIYDEI